MESVENNVGKQTCFRLETGFLEGEKEKEGGKEGDKKEGKEGGKEGGKKWVKKGQGEKEVRREK